MQMAVINGVDITPYIAHKGYKFQIEDLEASAERSMAGTLSRDRVARVPNVEITIKARLKQADVTRIINACSPAKLSATVYNSDTGNMVTTYFYAKVKSPSIYSTRFGYPEYESFSISLIGYGGI